MPASPAVPLTPPTPPLQAVAAGRPLEEIEAHFGKNDCIREFAVIPIEGKPGRFEAIVVPNVEEMRRRNVMFLWSRFREDLEKPNCTYDLRIDFDEIVFLMHPLPRDAAGAIDRAQLLVRVAAHKESRVAALSKAEEDLLGHPTAQRLLERLPTVFEPKRPLHPAYELERDLGLDSLDFVHVRAMLEQEFGVVVQDHETWEHVTLGDVLRRVIAAPPPANLAPRRHDWPARLAEPVRVPMEERWNYPRKLRHTAFILFARFVISTYGKLFHRLEIVNPEKIPHDGPFMLCPTHQSLIDGPFLWAILDNRRVQKLASIVFGEFFHQGPLARSVRNGHLILTGEADSVGDSMRIAYQWLKKGNILGVFPEGDRSWTDAVQTPRPGVGMLACEAQVPMIPVIFQGSKVLLSHYSSGMHPGKIRVVIGDAIPPPPKKDFTKADYRAHLEKWRSAVVELERQWGGRDAK